MLFLPFYLVFSVGRFTRFFVFLFSQGDSFEEGDFRVVESFAHRGENLVVEFSRYVFLGRVGNLRESYIIIYSLIFRSLV